MKLVVVAIESELSGDLPEGYQKLVTGVGKINAAMKLMECICEAESNCIDYESVINYGSAGSYPHLVGRLLPIRTVLDRDVDCTAFGLPKYVIPCDVESPGPIKCHTKINDIHEWKCGSGDCFTIPSPDYDVVDMEAYAFANICRYTIINFECYKYISDSGETTDWEENHNKGAKMFRELVLGETDETNQ